MGINQYRLKVGEKGYILLSELGRYAGISDEEAIQLYQNTASAERRRSHEIPFSLGIPVNKVNEYLGLDSAIIKRLAGEEKRIHDGSIDQESF